MVNGRINTKKRVKVGVYLAVLEAAEIVLRKTKLLLKGHLPKGHQLQIKAVTVGLIVLVNNYLLFRLLNRVLQVEV